HTRVPLLEEAQEAQVPVELEVGVDAALHQHPRAADLLELGELRADLLVREDVGVGLTTRAIEAAEAAADVAHVRVVDVAVDQVADGLGVGAHEPNLASGGGQAAERQLVQRDRFVRGQPLARCRLRQQAHDGQHNAAQNGTNAGLYTFEGRWVNWEY